MVTQDDGPDLQPASQEVTQAGADLARAELVDEMAPDRFTRVVEETRQLLDRRLQKVRELVDVASTDVNLNPFLMLALAPAYNIFSPFEAAEFVQISKLPHGDATAFGRFVEERILSIFDVEIPAEKAANKTLYSSIDREVTVDGTRYLMTLKAGPWTMNQSHANEMIASFPTIHDQSGCDIIIGIEYGRRSDLNNKPQLVITNTGPYVHTLVGREFWEFVTGVKDAHKHFYSAIRAAQVEFAKEHGGKTFHEHMIEARLRLAESFREAFHLGGDEVDMWEQIFDGAF